MGRIGLSLFVLACLPVEATATPSLPRRAAVGIYVLGPPQLIVGTEASYRVSLHWASAPEKTGPLPGAAIRVALVSANKRVRAVARGRSNANGDVKVRFVVPAIKPGEYRLRVSAAAAPGRAVEEQPVKLIAGGQILITTDKPLYRPGQTIHIRALALRAIDRQPIARQTILWHVLDSRGNLILSKRSRTSRFGVASTDLLLANEVNLGTYELLAALQQDSSIDGRKSVKVTRYRLPRFDVRLQTSRRSYRPEERLRGLVVARYFFGKPVAKARARIELFVRNCYRVASSLQCRAEKPQVVELEMDGRGRGRFSFSLPRGRGIGVCDEGEIRLRAEVSSRTGARRTVSIVRPFSQLRIQLASVVAGGSLAPGVPNRIHLLVADVQGRPLAHVPMTVRVAGRKRVLRSDALGTATVEVRPRAERSCSFGGRKGMKLAVSADGPVGRYRGRLSECLPIEGPALLVRALTPLVDPGTPLRVELLSPDAASGESGFLDVLRSGQSIASVSAPFQEGRARFIVPTGRSLSGLVILRGYRVSASGRRVTATTQTAYIRPPSRLLISSRADRSTYRPGDQAQIHFQVKDSRTRRGVQAAIGLVGVDQALLSLAPTRQDLRLFFSLPAYASEQTTRMNILPGRKSLSEWLLAGSGGRAQRAVEILLAATKPGVDETLETDPWKAREQQWQAQREALVEAAKAGVSRLALGIRTSKGWEFHPQLVPRLVRGGLVAARYVRDPWRRLVRPEPLVAYDPELSFKELANEAAPEKLARIYTELWRAAKRFNFKRRRLRGVPRAYLPVIIPANFRALLGRMRKIRSAELRDPWGFLFRRRRLTNTLLEAYDVGIYSQYEVFSVGPDGIAGTEDDVRPPGQRWKAETPQQLASILIELSRNVVGYGRGTGRLGGRRARAPRVLAGKAVRRGGFPDRTRRKLTRIRSRFPETLFWRPELITDQRGRASVSVALPDSITRWIVRADASSLLGAFGSASLSLRTFQPFFIEPDLPEQLTERDRVNVPVVVRNYTPTKQTVRIRIDVRSGLKIATPSQDVVLAPSASAVRYFSLQAARTGTHEVTFHARSLSGNFTDAVRRMVTVLPNGTEHATSHSGVIRRRGPVQHTLTVPADAITGSIHASVAIQPGPVGEVLTGLEGMLAMPDGCFEQTSSTLHPNVLVLDYLKRTGRAGAKIRRRALRYLRSGYQRLLTFEVKGGGFSWFGHAPANRVLTAYGLQQFVDLSRFVTVDLPLIKRTRQWLIASQKKDGSWSHDGRYGSGVNSSLQATAYIANAIANSGRGAKARQAVNSAVRYVERHVARSRDPYTLALVANLLATAKRRRLLGQTLERLWKRHRRQGERIVFSSKGSSLTYGSGRSGQTEIVALAALAMMRGDFRPEAIADLMQTLVRTKDRAGAWHSTQATVLALRALVADRQGRATPRGVLQLTAGKHRRTLRLNGRHSKTQLVDLSASIGRSGSHAVTVRFRGKGALKYQIVGSYWLPHRRGARSSGKLRIQARLDKQQSKKGEPLRLSVRATNRGKTRLNMPLVVVPLAPGFVVTGEQLERVAKKAGATKVQMRNNDAVFYFTELGVNKTIKLQLSLRSQYPLTVQQRPVVVYEYYCPENRAQSQPLTLRVK